MVKHGIKMTIYTLTFFQLEINEGNRIFDIDSTLLDH
jgi:hypothetical protein